MPVTVSTIADPLGTKLVIDVECNATAEAAVTAGATTIYAVECDNTANSTVPSYVKLLDDCWWCFRVGPNTIASGWCRTKRNICFWNRTSIHY